MNGYEAFSPQEAKSEDAKTQSHIPQKSPLGNFKNDDLILLGLIILLLTEDECEDKGLIAILAVLFLSGLGE